MAGQPFSMWQREDDDYISLRAAALCSSSQEQRYKKAPLCGSEALSTAIYSGATLTKAAEALLT
jgi:hypothetical protein